MNLYFQGFDLPSFVKFEHELDLGLGLETDLLTFQMHVMKNLHGKLDI